jgi:hypothetical protein
MSRQTRMDKTGPAVENRSNKVASVTSSVRSPTYNDAIELGACWLFIFVLLVSVLGLLDRYFFVFFVFIIDNKYFYIII